MKAILTYLIVILGWSAVAQNDPKQWTLQECIDYALENNTGIKQSELASELAFVDMQQALMDLYPSVNANIGTALSFDNPNANTSLNNNFGISSNLTIYDGHRNKMKIKLAEKNLEINKLRTQETIDHIALSIINAYLNVLYNRESVLIAQDQVTVNEKLLKRMKELVTSGTNAANDLFQVEANLANKQEALVKAENNFDIALLDLSQILQIDYTGFNIAPVNVNIQKASLSYAKSESVYKMALKNRAEIARANQEIENADLNIEMAQSGKKPVLSANYNFGTNFYYDVETDFTQRGYFEQLEKNRGHSLSLSLSIPIFDKNRTKSAVQKAQIRRDIANYNLENEKITLHAVVERAYIDAKTSLKTYETTKISVKAQEEAFRTAEERYNAGVLTSFDFDQVQTQLVQAKSAFIRAKYNYIFRTKLLDYYSGVPLSL